MKSIFRIVSVSVAAAMSLASCNDWLDLKPENSVTAADYWASEGDVSAAMTGIYVNTLGNASRMFMHGEMRADNVTLYATNSQSGGYQQVREGNITSSNTWAQWSAYYNVINNCNLLLEYADKALEQDSQFSVDECEIYKAQAKVMRSLMYFYLIRVWKDVPYVTWAYFDDDTERSCPVSSQLDILKDLISELEDVQRSNVLVDVTDRREVTAYALKALLADMYRLLGSLETAPAASQAAYSRCVALCDEIINSGQFTLIPVPKMTAAEYGGSILDDAKTSADSAFYVVNISDANDYFQQVFVNGNSAETIFELQSDNYSGATAFYNMLVGSARYVAPYRQRLDLTVYPSTENEVAVGFRDIRRNVSCLGLGDNVYCWKQAGSAVDEITIASSATEYNRNYIVYRLSEIYLMKAESLVQLAWANGDDQDQLLEAYMAVHKVRDRACAVETTDATLTNGAYFQVYFFNQLNSGDTIRLDDNVGLTASSMEQFVLDEECRELMFEGRRWFDILRNAERNQEGKGACTGGSLSYLISIVADATTVERATYLRNAYQKAESRYMPYPHDDVLTNEYLTQKPFYGVE